MQNTKLMIFIGREAKNEIFLVINLQDTKKVRTFALAFETEGKHGDPLAQLVEHNTFNVGVMGSSPMRITKKRTLLR